MENNPNLQLPLKSIGGVLLIIASCAVGCQSVDLSDISISPPPIGSVEDVISPKDRAVINQSLLNQSPKLILGDCDGRFPFQITTAKNDPYANAGSEICKKLQIRGQRMQCEVDSLLLEKPVSDTTGAKIELASWARCNGKIADLLIEGYYLPASEIERRLQICSSNYYADPGKMPKAGWYQRFLKWYTSNDLTPPPSDAALEVALKQSTPLDSRQDTAGLMKCEWMFSNSRTPQIDPLPSPSNNIAPTAPAKRPASK